LLLLRLIHEHHRDVVFDWVHAAAGITAQARAVPHETHGRLAFRAHEDFEERRIDGHREDYRQLSRRMPDVRRTAQDRLDGCVQP